VDIGKSPLLTPVVNNGFIAVLSTEPDGVTTAINEAGETLWTLDRADLTGEPDHCGIGMHGTEGAGHGHHGWHHLFARSV
jgi:hypothetical protein